MTQQGMSTKSRHLTIPDLITIGVHCLVFRAGRRGHAVQFRGFDGIRHDSSACGRRIDLWLRIYAPGCQGRKIRRD